MNSLTEIVDNVLLKLYSACPSQRGFRPVALFRDYNFTPAEMEKIINDCLELKVLSQKEDKRLVIAEHGYKIMKQYKSWMNYINSMHVIGGYNDLNEIDQKENQINNIQQQTKHSKLQTKIAFAVLILTIAGLIISIFK